MPNVRSGKNATYTFEMPRGLKRAMKKKSETNNFDLAPYFRYFALLFVLSDLSEAQDYVRKYNEHRMKLKNRRKVQNNGPRNTDETGRKQIGRRQDENGIDKQTKIYASIKSTSGKRGRKKTQRRSDGED